MFLYKILENPLFIELTFWLLWISIFIFYSIRLNKQNISKEIIFYLKLLFLFLTLIGFVRLYFPNILPFTPDGIYYLDGEYRPDLFGPNIYEYFISFINLLFGDNVKNLILINILFYCLSIKELVLIVPNYKNKNFNLFFFFAFLFPSVIWFIPNILRESLFIYFLVMVLKYSLINTNNSKIMISNIFKVLFFSFLAFSLRPQILPILFVWSSFALIKNKKVSLLLVTLLGFIVSQIEYIKTEILEKISWHYLESFKSEAANSLQKISFGELIIPENFYDLISYAPLLFFRFLFSPYPWDLSNTKYAFAYLDSVFIVIFFTIILYKFLKGNIQNYKIMLFAFLFLFVLSIFEISFTGSVRHRFPFIVILFPYLVINKKDSSNA